MALSRIQWSLMNLGVMNSSYIKLISTFLKLQNFTKKDCVLE